MTRPPQEARTPADGTAGEPLAELARAVAELASRRMPFGRYGPAGRPPSGLPLRDLPFEYLDWLKRKGFPSGRLGELLETLYQLKLDGAEDVFKALPDGGARGAPSGRPPRTLRFE